MSGWFVDRPCDRRGGCRQQSVLPRHRPGVFDRPVQGCPVRPRGGRGRDRRAVRLGSGCGSSGDPRRPNNSPASGCLRLIPDDPQGVPLRIRTVRVAVDKPGFIVSPTSCTEKKVAATVQSTTGAKADVSSRFQVGDCSRLAFTPRLGLRLTGRKQTRTGKHPGVRAVVRQAKGQANIGRAAVTLPGALALDPANARALCEYEDGTKPDLEDHCPKGSIVGRARAKTPLLDRPLVGDVYFVKNVRIDKDTGNKIRTLPMLIVALRGEIAINLKGTSNVKGGRLVNTFASVPDAPVTKFNLNINGGNNGILTVTDSTRGPLNICAARQTANVKMAGQNTKRANFRVRVKTPCKNKKR